MSVRYSRDRTYTGAYRIHATVRGDTAPLQMRAGLADDKDLEQRVFFSTEPVEITEADTWTEVSLLTSQAEGTQPTYVFFQFGGQGNVTVDFDRLFIMKTDEMVDVPVGVSGWELF